MTDVKFDLLLHGGAQGRNGEAATTGITVSSDYANRLKIGALARNGSDLNVHIDLPTKNVGEFLKGIVAETLMATPSLKKELMAQLRAAMILAEFAPDEPEPEDIASYHGV